MFKLNFKAKGLASTPILLVENLKKKLHNLVNFDSIIVLFIKNAFKFTRLSFKPYKGQR